MSGGGGSTTATTQNYSPAEAAQRAKVMEEANKIYGQTQQKLSSSPYPGAVPVTPSAMTQLGQAAAVGSVPQTYNMQNQVAQAQQFGLSDVLNPANNPSLQGHIAAAVRPITESYTDPNGVMAQIRSGATQAGQYGSSRQGIAEGVAAGKYADAVGDTSAKIAGDAYSQGLDTFRATLMAAPQSIATQGSAANVLSGVGNQQEQYQALQNEYEAAQRDWGLNSEWQGLRNYADLVYGAGGSESTSSQNSNPSALQNVAGMANAGLSAYAMYKLLGSAALASDRRLKQDIVEVGVDEKTGLPLYTFAYIADPTRRFIGVMADDVEFLYPEAVVYDEAGYAKVNYGMLGIEMKEVENG